MILLQSNKFNKKIILKIRFLIGPYDVDLFQINLIKLFINLDIDDIKNLFIKYENYILFFLMSFYQFK